MRILNKVFYCIFAALIISGCKTECPIAENSETQDNGPYRLSANFFNYKDEKVVVSYSNVPWEIFTRTDFLSGITKKYWQITEKKDDQIFMIGTTDPSLATFYSSHNGFMRAVTSKKTIVEELQNKGIIDDCFKNFEPVN